MSDHLIAEANRHAKALLKTTPKMNSKINPDRLALALALETVDQLERENSALERENAALREERNQLIDGLRSQVKQLTQCNRELAQEISQRKIREQLAAAQKEAQP